MALVKVGVVRLPVAAKIQYARQVVSQMTGNADFPSPVPTLGSLAAAADALEAAYNDAQVALAQARTAFSIQAKAAEALDRMMTQEGNYVENASGGDRAKIEGSGFSARNVPFGPIGFLSAPGNVQVVPSASPGTMVMKWGKVRGAYSYVVERAADAPELDWNSAAACTKTKVSVNTMTSGKKYWFRVAAVGAAGTGSWSDPIAKFAM